VPAVLTHSQGYGRGGYPRGGGFYAGDQNVDEFED